MQSSRSQIVVKSRLVEMLPTFSMGIGFLIISPRRTARRLKILPEATQIGSFTADSSTTAVVAGRSIGGRLLKHPDSEWRTPGIAEVI